ncbi:MAG: non-canonical purine NTP pyrophosphatase [Fimbriimonadaceae bacterium]|nr:non-canonical purine NTP pyrophosphatase [Fimbriimonadaceae bacterium]
MIERLVIATHNLKKAGEMVTILSQRLPGLKILTLADFPGAPEPEETGSTYWDNAAIKSASAADFTGEWCIADDAGLEVDAMGGEPGLMSKRFAGEETPFPEKMAIILDRLKNTPVEQRGARFRCCVSITPPSGVSAPAWQDSRRIGESVVFEATCEGRIANEPSGGGGFGYDPIFFLPELGCTMADLTAEQKHSISHRGKVLSTVGDYLEQLISSVNPASSPQ